MIMDEEPQEEEYGQIRFDRISYSKIFENGKYKPDTKMLRVKVFLELDPDEEETLVTQTGKTAY
jgi:hypothetical protein